MKRILKVLGAIVLVLVVAIGGLLAATFMGRRAVTDGQEVNAARIVADGFSGIAIVPVGEREVLLVDAGQDAGGQAILADLARRGLSVDAVTAILITHGHADHIGAIFSDSQEENRASLRRLAQRLQQEGMTVKAIVPAHSGPVEGLAPLTAFAQSN